MSMKLQTNFQPGGRVRVIIAHQSSFPDPLIVKAGEQLTLGRGDTDWTGWLWCTSQTGHSGWVPESYLDYQQGNLVLANRDYDATELAAAIGEELTVHQAESGWLWCANPSGQQGWIPADNVKKL